MARNVQGRGGCRRRLTVYLVVVPFALLLMLWVWVFLVTTQVTEGPTGSDFGADTAVYQSAAIVVKAGGNPFNQRLLVHTDDKLLERAGLPGRGENGFVRVGSPGLLFWLLTPLATLPFRTFAAIWTLFAAACSLTGMLGVLAWQGWRARAVPLIVFATLPQTLFGPYYGNVTCVVFGAIGLALWLEERFPVGAGALLCLVWLKPHIGLPALLLIVLFHARRSRSVLAAFLASSVVMLAIMVAVMGGSSVQQWAHGLVDYSATLTLQADLVSLTGLYYRMVGGTERLLLEGVTVCVALLLTGVTWLRLRHAERSTNSIAWLWALWLLATPYAHLYDEVLLAVPFVLAWGRSGAPRLQPALMKALYLALLSSIVWKIHPQNMSLLPLPLLGIVVCLALHGRGVASGARSEDGGGGGIRTPEALRS